jgi:hypothetical protein
MSLHAAAQHLAAKGRGEDKVLIHMTPGEVHGLQAIAKAHGGSLTINPETGLPEAGFLSKILPMVAGAGLMAMTGGAAAPAAAGLFGLGMPATIGLGVGGIEALRTGNLGKGIMAGLGAYGGAGLMGGLAGMGAAGAGVQSAAGFTPEIAAGTPLSEVAGTQIVAPANAPILGSQTLGDAYAGLGKIAENPTQGLSNLWTGMGDSTKKRLATTAALASPLLEQEPKDLPTAQGSGPNPYSYTYQPNVTTPFPLPNVPGYDGLNQNFGREQRYYSGQYVPTAAEGGTVSYKDGGESGVEPFVNVGKHKINDTEIQNLMAGLGTDEASLGINLSKMKQGEKETLVHGLLASYRKDGAGVSASLNRPDDAPEGLYSANLNASYPFGSGRFNLGVDALRTPEGMSDVTGYSAGYSSKLGPGYLNAGVYQPKSAPQERRYQASYQIPFADGGPIGAMNSTYPQAGLSQSQYANAWQTPVPREMLASGTDTGVNPMNGQMSFAQGGISDLGGYSDGGRLLRGPGDGVSDSIPAMIGNKQPARLADGEFVVPARIVSELGNGSTESGARKLYAMMDRVQKARGKTVGKSKIAANSRADKYLPA